MEVIRKYAINTVTIAHLGTNRETIQVNLHQSAWFSKVYNFIKLDVRSLEIMGWYSLCTLDRNRKFSEIKRSKMLKLAKGTLLLDSSRQNNPKRPYFTKVGDFIGDFYQQISQKFVTLPRLLWKRYHFYGVYISACARTL